MTLLVCCSCDEHYGGDPLACAQSIASGTKIPCACDCHRAQARKVIDAGKLELADFRNKLLREALTWAVGFIRCNAPAGQEYPDFRNCCDLLADGKQIITGEFTLTRHRAELAEEERDRFRAALEMLAQIRHVSGSAQSVFRANLAIVDAVLAGADVRDLEVVEAIAEGTWKS